MNFDHTHITSINIKFDNGTWNPETHNIILEHDPNSALKFKIKIVALEPEVINVSEANAFLKKFGLNK